MEGDDLGGDQASLNQGETGGKPGGLASLGTSSMSTVYTPPSPGRHLRPPRPDHPVAELSGKRIQRRPILGGLINEYERAA
jgi:hypothetical protein